MLTVGQLIGNYRIVRLVCEGGMGLVYEARHEYIDRRAAIKILRPDLASDERLLRRFLNEARAVNLTRHPGLVEIFEFGLLPDGMPHIVMEFLAGESIRERMLRRGGPLREAPRFVREIALALGAAHEAGIVHRDVKPHNIMIVPAIEAPAGEIAKVLDFGIAKLPASQTPHARIGDDSPTRTGVALGTPEYMAPEQCRDGAQVDGKADVYALGVMLYEMLAGVRPFVSDLPAELMTMHVRSVPRPLGELIPALPGSLVALVHRMLAKEPGERPTMQRVAELLDPWKEASLPEAIFGTEARGLSTSSTEPSVPALPKETTRSLDGKGEKRALIGSRSLTRVAGLLLLLALPILGGFLARKERAAPASATTKPRLVPEPSAAPPLIQDAVPAAPPAPAAVKQESAPPEAAPVTPKLRTPPPARVRPAASRVQRPALPKDPEPPMNQKQEPEVIVPMFQDRSPRER